jgi:hypothetical protein
MIQIKDENGISLIETSLTYKWNSSSSFSQLIYPNIYSLKQNDYQNNKSKFNLKKMVVSLLFRGCIKKYMNNTLTSSRFFMQTCDNNKKLWRKEKI